MKYERKRLKLFLFQHKYIKRRTMLEVIIASLHGSSNGSIFNSSYIMVSLL